MIGRLPNVDVKAKAWRLAAHRKRLRRIGPSTPRQVHVGCGDVRIPGFVNVDIDPTTRAELVSDIRLRRFPDGFADTIYACHVLEHMAHDEVPGILAAWHRVLAPDGSLYVSVPDLDRIVRIYAANWQHFQTRPNTPWIGLLYGGQDDPYDFHRTGFNLCWMTELLERAGFCDVEEYPHEPHPFGVVDASLAREPFGEYVSLNVRARRRRMSPTR